MNVEKNKTTTCNQQEQSVNTFERIMRRDGFVNKIVKKLTSKPDDTPPTPDDINSYKDLPQNFRKFMSKRFKNEQDEFATYVYKKILPKHRKEIERSRACIYELLDKDAQRLIDREIDWNRLKFEKTSWLTFVYQPSTLVRYANSIPLLEVPITISDIIDETMHDRESA